MDGNFFVIPNVPQKSFYAQDTVHILAKLRKRLITPSNLVVIGSETACRAHLQFVIDTYSKSKHGLTIRCIDHKDKQNFESVGVLVSENVEPCLKEATHKLRTKDTIMYLQLMRNVF